MSETFLKISKGGLPPFSARGCRQVLKSMAMGEMKRTINGELIFLGTQKDEKYASSIYGHDAAPPALENLSPGDVLRVSCLSKIVQHFKGDGQAAVTALKRPPVKGSVLAHTHGGAEVSFTEASSKIRFQEPPPAGENIYIAYRPLLTMMVTHISMETHEWDLKCAWTLSLEET